MTICYPSTTDWSCAFDQAELQALRDVPASAHNLAVSEAFAWYLLASLTGYRIGVCPVTVRPCASRCAPSGTWLVAPVSRASTAALGGRIGLLNPFISGGVWYNACGCRDQCECTNLPAVDLPGPVGKIESVMLEGVELDPTAYRVEDGSRLVRTDGEPWPACNDGTFEVTYYRGAAPNIMIERAAGILAHEFYLSCEGGACRLPSNVVRASRGGESYEFQPTDFPDGQTDIPEVNAVIRIYNPNGLKMPVTMASPETVGTGGRMTTWRRR
jgi:hypothetical protein